MKKLIPAFMHSLTLRAMLCSLSAVILVGSFAIATPANAASTLPYRTANARCWWLDAKAQTRHHVAIVCLKKSNSKKMYWKLAPKSTILRPSGSTILPPTNIQAPASAPSYHILWDSGRASGNVTGATVNYSGNATIELRYTNGCQNGWDKGTSVSIGQASVGFGNGPTSGFKYLNYYGWRDSGQPFIVTSDPTCHWSISATATF